MKRASEAEAKELLKQCWQHAITGILLCRDAARTANDTEEQERLTALEDKLRQWAGVAE